MFRWRLVLMFLLVCPVQTNNVRNHTCFINSDADLADRTAVPTEVKVSWVVIGIANGLLAVPTAVLNSLIIWTILSDQRLRGSNYNILLTALALTDFVIGVFAQPLFSWYFSCLPFNCHFPCQYSIIALTLLICGVMSLCTLSIASFERYLAIEHPFFHRTRLTPAKVIAVTLIVWFTAAPVTTALRVIFDGLDIARKLSVFIIITFNAVVILFCNVKINITAYRSKRRIAAQRNTEQTAKEKQEMQRKLEDYRMAISMSFMVLGTVVCYLPIMLFIILEVAGVAHYPYFLLFQPLYLTFIQVQSLVNPIIMSLRIKYIRDGIKKKFK